MTITQLRYFVAVCKYGKIRTAAERLFVSAPTLSVAVRNLEEELDVSLFIRSNGRLILTEAGKQLLQYANNILAECDGIEAEVKRIKNSMSVIHIGAPSTLCEYPAAKLIEGFMTEHPSVLFELSQMSSLEALQQLEEGKIDFAICDGQEVHSDTVESIELLESTVGGYVHKNHRLAGARNVTPQMLAEEPLLLLSRRAMPSNEIIHWFQTANINPNIFMYQFREILSVTFTMVRSHNAPVFLLDAMFDGVIPDDISRFSLDFPLKFKILMACKTGRVLPEPARDFYNYCRRSRTQEQDS